ncbi:MAG: glycosyltransferase family 2 protein, partial [Allobaculum sp.]|nr:glycosyltransferase family 2 protein [Allobaculum sp.]
MVSIFIPTYNSSSSIGQTLDSVINQTYTDLEILCVDDSSTDDTLDIIHKYAERDKRVNVFCKPNEGSVPFSWKYIFPKISGEFTLYMSHDDLLLPDTVSKLLDDQKKHNADCTIPVVRFFGKDISTPEVSYEKINRQYSSRVGSSITGLQAFVLMLDYSIPGFGLWRTELIRKLGIHTTSFNSDEFAQRLWIKKCRTVTFSSAVFGYYQTESSIVKGFKPYHLYSLDTNLRLFSEMVADIKNIPKDKAKFFRYKFYLSLLYLARIFFHNLKEYDLKMQQDIMELIEQSRKTYGILPLPETIRESFAFICSLSKHTFYLY